MTNLQRQIDTTKREADIARDNVQILGSKAQEIQRALMEASQQKGKKTQRLQSALEKIKVLVHRKQKDFDTQMKQFEKAQQEFTKAQESLQIAQEQYTKLEQEYQIETRNEQNGIEHTRTKLDRELSRIQREQKAEMARMNNAMRDVTLIEKRNMEEMSRNASNDNHAPTGRHGRSTFQRAA